MAKLAPKTMGATEFKARCLEVFDSVRETRRPYVITKRGVPVVQVVPLEETEPFRLGSLEGQFPDLGDEIVASRHTEAEWAAMARVELDRVLGKPEPRTTPSPAGRARVATARRKARRG